MTYRITRDAHGRMTGAQCDTCGNHIEARTDRALTTLTRGHSCRPTRKD